ncbi:MAG: LysM peptidoglycan-binding domain-containing protein [Chloroflexi bacterium]|nr:LysM peptidoglycan-binding domain-containing protein [Chloroflexota bacterium]
MKNWKRLFYYLLLNVLVSVCATLTTLTLWERFRAPVDLSLAGNPTADPAATQALPLLLTPTAAQAVQPSATPVPTEPENVIAYEVESGDTLGTIAEEFGVSVEELLQLNQINDRDAISPGQAIYVPVTPAPKTPTPIPTTPSAAAPAGPAQAEISAVIEPGNLTSEVVILVHKGSGELPLQGWKIQDEDGNAYTFPQFTLYTGAVYLWSKAGTNTVAELFWGLNQPAWESGETVTLRDAAGTLRAEFVVP